MRPAALFFLLGLFYGVHMFAHVDQDLFFHVKEGEKILLQSRFPVEEEFSFTAAGKKMVATEWAAQAILYLVFRALGYPGLVGFHVLLLLASLAVLRRFLRDEAPPALVAPLLCLAAFCLLNFVAVRIQAFTILFFSVYLFWAKLWEQGRRWAPWAMAAVLPFWANLHGGFMLGWMLLGFICLLDFNKTRRLRELAAWLAGTLLCFLHPNGVTAFVYPLWFMAFPPPSRSMILEWTALDFSKLSAAPYLLLIGALCWAGLDLRGRKFPWAVLVLVLLAVSLSERKLLPLFSLAAVAALGLSLGRRPLTARQSKLCTAFAAALLLAMGALEWSFARRRPWLDWESSYPKAAAEFFARHYAGRRIFHSYDWGGYLIYKLAPGTKIFIDGRLDPYWALLSGDYSDVMEARPGWKGLLDHWAIEAVLLPPASRPAYGLNEDRRWQAVYADEKAVLFVRRQI